MNPKLKQCILEMLRMGEDPEVLASTLHDAMIDLRGVKNFVPNHDKADFYRAYKDADHRP